MKTKLKLFALIFAVLCVAIVLMPNQVLATEELVEVDTYEELRDALESGKSVKLMNNIEITGKSVVKSSRSLGVAIMAAEDVVVDGNGFTITSAAGKVRTTLEVYADETAVNVTFKNITVTNAYSGGRAIDTRTGNITLNLEKAKLETTGSGNTQALTIGGTTGPVNVNITNNSTLEAKKAGYGIIAFNPVKMTIKDSYITGYGALYMREANGSMGSAGSVVNISKSTLTGINNCNEPDLENRQNGFGTIVFMDHNIELNVNDSKLIASGDGDATQVVIGEHKSLGESNTPNKVTISGNTVITAQEAIASMKNTKATVILNKGVTSNIEIPTKLLASGTVAKKENDLFVVSELEIDYVVSEEAEVEEVKQTLNASLNSSLKANETLYKDVQEAVQSGENIAVEVKVEELKQEDIKEEEKTKMTAVVSKDGKVHQYFDISVLVMANQREIGKLTELTDKVKLSMKLPKDLAKEGRKFYILKLHNGEVEKIEATVNGENLEFETKEFSLYALAYEDVPANEKDDTPKMGTINVSYVWVALVAIALVGIATTKKVSKHSK